MSYVCFGAALVVQAAVLLLFGFVPVIQSVAKFLRKYREKGPVSSQTAGEAV